MSGSKDVVIRVRGETDEASLERVEALVAQNAATIAATCAKLDAIVAMLAAPPLSGMAHRDSDGSYTYDEHMRKVYTSGLGLARQQVP